MSLDDFPVKKQESPVDPHQSYRTGEEKDILLGDPSEIDAHTTVYQGIEKLYNRSATRVIKHLCSSKQEYPCTKEQAADAIQEGFRRLLEIANKDPTRLLPILESEIFSYRYFSTIVKNVLHEEYRSNRGRDTQLVKNPPSRIPRQNMLELRIKSLEILANIKKTYSGTRWRCFEMFRIRYIPIKEISEIESVSESEVRNNARNIMKVIRRRLRSEGLLDEGEI